MKKIIAFLLGAREFRLSWTWADPTRSDYNPYTELDEAYDRGREFAHRITFRRFESI